MDPKQLNEIIEYMRQVNQDYPGATAEELISWAAADFPGDIEENDWEWSRPGHPVLEAAQEIAHNPKGKRPSWPNRANRRTNMKRTARKFGQRGIGRRRHPGALSDVGQKVQELQRALEEGEITAEEFESHLEQLEAQQRHSRAARVLIARARRAVERNAAVEAADVMLLQNAVKQLAKMESADHAVRMLRDIIDAAEEMKRELEG